MPVISLNIPQDLCEEATKRAKELYITRNSFIITSIVQRMQADDAMEMLPDAIKAIEVINNKAKRKAKSADRE